MFQLILNPIRDWNLSFLLAPKLGQTFQLILNPIRDWNIEVVTEWEDGSIVPINLKPY